MKCSLIVIAIAIAFVGCKPKPDEYLSKAKAQVDAKNYALAIEEYQKLVKDHPDSPQTEEAMFTVASLYHNDLKDFAAAAKAYQAFADKYPKSDKAPTSLFLVGFLYNEELKNLENAKKAYESFLALYPQHEMADDAQFELKNLGKSPEELLPAIPQEPPVAASKTAKISKKN